MFNYEHENCLSGNFRRCCDVYNDSKSHHAPYFLHSRNNTSAYRHKIGSVHYTFNYGLEVVITRMFRNVFFVFVLNKSFRVVSATVGSSGFRKHHRALGVSVENSSKYISDAVEKIAIGVSAPVFLRYRGSEKYYDAIIKGFLGRSCKYVGFCVEDSIKYGGTRLPRRKR